MLVFPLVQNALVLFALVLGCSAPRTSKSRSTRFRGAKATIRKGQITDQVQTFITRLSEQELFALNQVKYWIDTQAHPEYQRRLLNNLFQGGTNRSPTLLSLGTNDAGDHMAVSILKPDIETAALLAGQNGEDPEVGQPVKAWC